MATGRNDFLWGSVMHLGGITLTESSALSDQNIIKCETLSKIFCSFISIFLSDTTVRESHSIPTTSMAFHTSLLSLLVSATLNLLSQHTTAQRIGLTTTDSSKILRIVGQMLKDLSGLRK